ncbi:hypothetical protein TREMEDRAFT_62665 [Tremella mesenterica DSM 1558]|uniref:uncharacterized protein n=1 Tax=Tremella mesenterica (strain ATCC 24925 / CBS 8224 / DSM 1558 / NBRC 9311 / NRRL Y-6157 / RJB 2259-6 / UBC 559-6) TaxID=578456 RepID=UPI0003F49249|nr:uncharacterized protein TREMEDRAFT_62665 [Tremella mesenterica DSM 1558]EIW68952.1 hypothetical protein TREMEDRAFT_62665 [Tremella mesenterica DSM 1558]
MSAEESQYWDQDQSEYDDGDYEEIEVERYDEDLTQPLQDMSLVPFRRSNTGPGTISSSLTNSQLSRTSTFNNSKATNTSKSGVRKPGSKTSKQSNSNKFPSRALTKPKDPLSFIDDLPFLPDPRHKVYLRQRLQTLCSLVHLYPAQDSMRGSAYTTIIPRPSKSMKYQTKINDTDVPPNDTVEPLSRSDSRSFRRTNSTMSLTSSPSRSRRSNYSITNEDKLSLDHLAACIYSWASQSLLLIIYNLKESVR